MTETLYQVLLDCFRVELRRALNFFGDPYLNPESEMFRKGFEDAQIAFECVSLSMEDVPLTRSDRKELLSHLGLLEKQLKSFRGSVTPLNSMAHCAQTADSYR